MGKILKAVMAVMAVMAVVAVVVVVDTIYYYSPKPASRQAATSTPTDFSFFSNFSKACSSKARIYNDGQSSIIADCDNASRKNDARNGCLLDNGILFKGKDGGAWCVKYIIDGAAR